MKKDLRKRHDAETGKERMIVLAHTDYSADIAERRSRGEHRVMERRHIPSLRKGEVNVICEHVGGETQYFSTFPIKKMLSGTTILERALHGIDCMLQEAEESSTEFSIVTTVEEIKKTKSENKVGIVLCLQGGMPIDQDLGLLRIFQRLGIRCMHLTANLRNQISDSCMGRTNGGLTDFGVEVVREMNRLGLVIDIAQLSPTGCLEVLDLSTQSVIASNSNVKTLCNHPRNLDDEVIKQLAENGGVMGVHCLSIFVSEKPNPTIENLLQHVDYVVNLTGVDHVGIGPDLLENWPKEMYRHIWAGEKTLESNFLESAYVKGLENISKIPELADTLRNRGYSNTDVKKILGGNFLRVFQKVWGR